ncbi:MAG: peptidoglycan-binding protein [Firmicutes bacterium]|nr:peptidoglycan-binding protein [Bacillota bacterium]
MVDLGDHGPCVGLVQQLLIQKGYNPGPVDCVFGSQTEAAVKQFQAAAGLVVDGIVGPKTWLALESGTSGGGGSPITPEQCQAAGGIWDPINKICIPQPPPEPPKPDYLLYCLIGGAVVVSGLGIYLIVSRSFGSR